MDEFSFDPKSWGKQRPPKDNGAKPAPKSDDNAKAESLPEAWKKVSTEFEPARPASPTSPPTTPASPAPGPPDGSLPTRREAEPSQRAAPADGDAAIPDAWRSVATGFRPDPQVAPAAEFSGQAEPGSTNRKALITLAAAVLLAGGGGWAWLTRLPASANVNQAKPQPAAAPSQPTADSDAVERALNMSSPSELEAALTAMGVPGPEAKAAVQAALPLLTGKGVIRARALLVPEGDGFRLQQLEATYLDGSGASVTRGIAGQFTAEKVGAALDRKIRVLRGELDSESFYTSAVSAGVVDTLIPEFINAFTYDFNLASEVSAGDTFEVGFEEMVNADGEMVGQPKLLYASLTTKAKSLALYRYIMPDGKVAWYDGNGRVTKRGFMRTPIDGARITSKFGPRFHPVLHYTRLHGGTDFAAPVGTPIYAAADATVLSASPSRCAGNMAVLNHANAYQTRYFHLSRYAEGLHAGQAVKQGETIGFVGNTGTCTTGPHLHYEVHIDGQKVDPLSIKTDDAKREQLDPGQLAGFMKERDRIDSARAQQAF